MLALLFKNGDNDSTRDSFIRYYSNISNNRYLSNIILIMSCYGMGILNIDLNNNNNSGHTNYDKDDPDTIIFIRLLP